ncbi:ComEA family DNA-binding protein [Thermophagus sp. OGC60D27]|uniref:ComEA family DNA-binding protein n=1 Tax=Thermophagus sp. OGC60D27 TaxID=3458415 RepID=UPI0040384408
MWKDWLAFSRKEQYGIIILAVLLFVFVVGRILMTFLWKPPAVEVQKDATEFIEYKRGIDKRQEAKEKERSEGPQYRFKTFNPNEVTVTDLDEMGLPHYVIINWMKYLEAGGTFKQPGDIAKIYGLDSLLAQKLSAYVLFPDRQEDFRNNRVIHPDNIDSTFAHDVYPNLQKKDQEMDRRGGNEVVADTFIIDLNSAVASDLKRLNGIGEVLSQRIIKYRDLLGGFYSSDQVLEVYGISPPLYDNIRQYLTVEGAPYRKIAINRSSVRYLKSHPYLNFYQARDIIEYRKKNGNISSAKELKLIPSMDDQTLEKIIPYIDFGTDK